MRICVTFSPDSAVDPRRPCQTHPEAGWRRRGLGSPLRIRRRRRSLPRDLRPSRWEPARTLKARAFAAGFRGAAQGPELLRRLWADRSAARPIPQPPIPRAGVPAEVHGMAPVSPQVQGASIGPLRYSRIAGPSPGRVCARSARISSTATRVERPDRSSVRDPSPELAYPRRLEFL